MILRHQMAWAGLAIGAGIAAAWGLLTDSSIELIGRRTLLLGLTGGWIGLLLGWLHELLPSSETDNDESSGDARA